MDADPQPKTTSMLESSGFHDDEESDTIPSRWRRDRPEDFIIWPEATHQVLLVMSPKEFAKMSSVAETERKVSARDRRVFLRQPHSRANTQASDRRGRLVLRTNFAKKWIKERSRARRQFVGFEIEFATLETRTRRGKRLYIPACSEGIGV